MTHENGNLLPSPSALAGGRDRFFFDFHTLPITITTTLTTTMFVEGVIFRTGIREGGGG
jgi:hypothetical protein